MLARQSDILNTYLIPSFDVLHTQSRQYIVDDILSLMRERGVLPWLKCIMVLLWKSVSRTSRFRGKPLTSDKVFMSHFFGNRLSDGRCAGNDAARKPSLTHMFSMTVPVLLPDFGWKISRDTILPGCISLWQIGMDKLRTLMTSSVEVWPITRYSIRWNCSLMVWFPKKKHWGGWNLKSRITSSASVVRI